MSYYIVFFIFLCKINCIFSTQIYTCCEKHRPSDKESFINKNICIISQIFATSDDDIRLIGNSTLSTLENVFRGSEYECDAYLQNLSSVTEIIFSNSSTASIPRNLFENFQNTRVLNASSVGVEKINAMDFEHARKLERIILDHNSIREIPGNVLMNSVVLTFVDLSHNAISKIDAMAFQGTAQLRFMNLSFNQLTRLNEQMFSNLTKLEDENHNDLVALDADLFRNNINLMSIGLSYNRLLNIDCQLFKSLNIFHLNLSRNLERIVFQEQIANFHC